MGMSKSPPIMGRPTKEPAERLSEIIQFRLTSAEREQCEQAAEQTGTKFSQWIRDCILKAAKRQLKT